MNQPAMGGIDPMALMGRLGEEAKKEENDGDNNQAAAEDDEDEEARAEASKYYFLFPLYSQHVINFPFIFAMQRRKRLGIK